MKRIAAVVALSLIVAGCSSGSSSHAASSTTRSVATSAAATSTTSRACEEIAAQNAPQEKWNLAVDRWNKLSTAGRGGFTNYIAWAKASHLPTVNPGTGTVTVDGCPKMPGDD